MARPLSISGQDLVQWADQYPAAATLPALVRRLLLATTPLASIDMRADSGTRLGGWDGEVMARRPTPWCPLGHSVWEVSVRDDVKTKLEEDFDKRMLKPDLPVDSRLVTYIAVAARRFDKKKAWAKEKAAKGRWADVRVYDVDDLASWLEQAPAVATWFASYALGRVTQDVRTVEEFLYEFSHFSQPPLPASVVLSGEARAKAANVMVEIRFPSRYLAGARRTTRIAKSCSMMPLSS